MFDDIQNVLEINAYNHRDKRRYVVEKAKSMDSNFAMELLMKEKKARLTV